LKGNSEIVIKYDYEFPILGGRLLKNHTDMRNYFANEFPILGGRLLKWKTRMLLSAVASFQSLEGGY